MAAMQEYATCDTCFSLAPLEEYRKQGGGWETACAACRSTARPSKRGRSDVEEQEPSIEQQSTTAGQGASDESDVAGSQVAALMRIDLFQGALRGTTPEAARALMQQLLEAQGRGQLDGEAVADVALAFLAQHAPPGGTPAQQQQQAAPPAGPLPSPGQLPSPQQQQQQQVGAPPLASSPAAGQQQVQQPPATQVQQQRLLLDAVPLQVLRLILAAPPERCRRQLCALARRSPLLLGQVLSAADPAQLLAAGHLTPEDLLSALQQQPPMQLPALAVVAAAAALLATVPPGPSPQLLHLIRVLAEGHQLLAIVEAGHLAPEALRAALQGAEPAAFTDIFKAMCTNDVAGQSFLKQCMQRAMPRADYGELMRISMLAEVAKTASTVTDRATLLGLLDKAFAIE